MAGTGRTNVLSRASAVSRVLFRVLLLNLAVAGAKLVFGYATGSVSIISDGFHSLADSASNIMGLVATRAARKPPDEDHPYGHRKYETLAAAGIVVFLLFAVIEVARAAVARLASEQPTRVTALSFGIMAVTLVINLVVVRYESRAARRLTSELLLADAMHTRSDVLTSCAVIASLAAVKLGYPIFDPLGGVFIAAFITRTAWHVARDTSQILSDRVVLVEEDIRTVVMGVGEVVGCHQIRSRGSADHIFLDLHVWFRGDTTLHEAHRLSHVVKDRLRDAFPQIADAIIHIEPPPKDM
ncbi:MAG TPA: cation diffusion facilitator family transporter [Vicinamibacterales bacterium]|nr:cation diffusion facilitator family transporter [Vicinamibacterales bacterium]